MTTGLLVFLALGLAAFLSLGGLWLHLITAFPLDDHAHPTHQQPWRTVTPTPPATAPSSAAHPPSTSTPGGRWVVAWPGLRTPDGHATTPTIPITVHIGHPDHREAA
ncbi:hypothetical protein [Goodfellowiella coeruleoviolacea]|uniref:hypothetical protein n=1 Tax=Goodfellowiella coeruleoviolacea TaxID=334858 RepID=UPI0020A4059E|nr:hypothetical protein [Goodfellowiella coeruleoviolacea]